MSESEEWPHGFGFCYCGCGHKTNIAKSTVTKFGHIKGQPMHYILGHGTVGKFRPIGPRFWSRLAVGEADSCWEWQGAHRVDGYGIMYVRGKWTGAHRVAYELAYGPIPAGMMICHTCDNPPCCNPNHLYAGTAVENAWDAVDRGRHYPNPSNPLKSFPPVRRGEDNNKAKLSSDDVRAIRRLYQDGTGPTAIAQSFGVSRVQVHNIVKRKSWAHIA